MEWTFGAVRWWCCWDGAGVGENLEVAELTIDPEVAGYMSETPTNCDVHGVFIFDEDPPPGGIAASAYFRWVGGRVCNASASS